MSAAGASPRRDPVAEKESESRRVHFYETGADEEYLRYGRGVFLWNSRGSSSVSPLGSRSCFRFPNA